MSKYLKDLPDEDVPEGLAHLVRVETTDASTAENLMAAAGPADAGTTCLPETIRK